MLARLGKRHRRRAWAPDNGRDGLRTRLLTPAYKVIDGQVDGRPAITLVSAVGGLRATFVPSLAMLGTSLTLGGDELLGQRSGVRAYVDRAKTMGIPLLHPWANRLQSESFGEPSFVLDQSSPLVHFDDNGLPIHGLHLVDVGWTLTERFADEQGARATATLSVERDDLLSLFPFPHEITVSASLSASTLRLDTHVRSTGEPPVPIAFGWHPYLQLPRDDRRDWQVGLPVTRRAILDERMLPTGVVEVVEPETARLGDRTFDDLFTGLRDPPVFTLDGHDTHVEVAFGEGYPCAQVYAPADDDVIAFEPMTAPTNALVTGIGLPVVAPGAAFTATFSITAVPR